MKDLQTGKPTNVHQVLDQVMDSIALVVNANYIYLVYRPGGPYWKKTVPEVLSIRTQDRGHSFPNTDRPRPANNVFIFFFRRVLCKQFLC